MALNEQSSFPLVLMTSITAPLLGAVNTLLYSCSADMRQQMRPSFIWVSLIFVHSFSLVFVRSTNDRKFSKMVSCSLRT